MMRAAKHPLSKYQGKRNFSRTAEPEAGGVPNESARSFVIQKHWARRLHYDFRLELGSVMKSWAVPKGPSLDPADKRMAVHVEDHPISYNEFEGEIPSGQYGAGKVIVWDKGFWSPSDDPVRAYEDGKLKFRLHGEKLQGLWTLVRIKNRSSGTQDAWLLIKENDEYARPADEYSIVDALPDSVKVGPTSIETGNDEKSAGAKGPKRKSAEEKSPVRASRSENTYDMPARLAPQLAVLASDPPKDAEHWLYEVKFDGYRLLARIRKQRVAFFTRNGNDWSAKLKPLCAAIAELALPDGWYDGEIVVHDKHGIPDFQALQNAFESRRADNIVYYLFDLPFSEGHDLRSTPLIERRNRLETLLDGKETDLIKFSRAFAVSGRDIIASACRLGLEGVIGKRKDSLYISRRSTDWIKLKCGFRQEFVIGGYTDPKNSRTGVGALLLGFHDRQKKLRYAGKVGTGFSEKTLAHLSKQLPSLGIPIRPFADATDSDRSAHWIKPVLIAEVAFAQWTRTGRLRHAVFHGLRDDKAPESITREISMLPQSNPETGTDPAAEKLLQKQRLSNPDRVIDQTSGATKADLARYYARIAPLMLEHLKGRPVALLRAPQGIQKEMFFQKHLETAKMPGINALPEELDPDHEALMEVARAEGLVSAAQMNVIEFHTWNAIKTSISRPDRMVFDLDPGKGVEWPAMQEAAVLLQAFLEELKLTPFLKTSGGKGLHLIVPLKRRHDWDTVKGFSQAVVQHLAQQLPGRFAAKSGPKNRVGKIFIDYLRNGFGATTATAWSVRARPGLAVSIPIAWDELQSLAGADQWNIRNIDSRIKIGNKPWDGYRDAARTLTASMKMLDFRPAPKR